MQTPVTVPSSVLKAFEAVPDLYLILSPKLKILTASDAYLKATYAVREEIVGRQLFDVFPNNPMAKAANGVENLNCSLQQVLTTKRPHRMAVQQYDVPLPAAQGGGFVEKYWLPLNTPVLDEQGQVQFIIHKVEDITGQQKLLQSKNLLQDVIDAPNIGIAVYKALRNEKGEITDFVHEYINRASLAMLGGEDFTGKLFSDHGENGTLQLPQLVEVIEAGKRNEYIREADFQGREVWFAITNTPLDSERLVHTWEDVTERKKAEEEILRLKDDLARKATDKYYAIFNSIDEGFCIIEVLYDEQGELIDFRYNEVNPAFEKQTGLTNVKGKTIKNLTADATEHYWLQEYARVAETGEAIHFENYHEATKRWYHVYASRVSDESNRLVALVFNDITERKRREQQQAFLLNFSDTLRTLSGREAIEKASLRLISEFFGLDRSYIATVNKSENRALIRAEYNPKGLPSVLGEYRLSDFPEGVRRIEEGTLIIENVETDATLSDLDKASLTAIRLAAVVSSCLRKGERNVIWSFAPASSIPRIWSNDEVELIEEVTERTWAVIERAKAEEALRKSQEHFQLIANLAPDLLWESEADGSTNWFNQRWLEYTGQSIEEAIGWGWMNAIHPDDREGSAQDYGEAVETGKPLRQEHRIRNREGEYRWFAVSALSLKDENGHVVKIYGSATDIHDRKQAEEALRDSEERLQKVLSIETVGVIYFKLEGAIHDSNAAIERMSGYSKADLTSGKVRWDELTPPEFMEATFNSKEELITKGQNSPYEKQCIRPDGTRWWGLFAGKRLSEKECVEFVVDITKQKEAEEKLQQFNELLEQQIAERTSDLWKTAQELQNNLAKLQQAEEVAQMGSWEYDVASGEMSWSAGMYRLFGLPAGSSVKPEIYLEHAVEEDKPLAQQVVKKMRESFEPIEETLRLHVAGQALSFLVKTVVQRNEQGEPVKILGIDLNISEVKRLEEENLQMRLNQQKALLLAVLEAQEEERRRISEALHNGVGQTLYATKLNMERVERENADEDQALQKSNTLLHRAINEVRQVSHELTPVLLQEFGLEAALEDLCRGYEHSSLHVSCKVEGLQGRLEDYLEVSLYRMTQELVSNVIKHAEATRAFIHLARQGSRFLLEVRDNGKGISSEPGNGLGLRSIMDRVKLLNGTFSIGTPKTGKGTLVAVRIPVTGMN